MPHIQAWARVPSCPPTALPSIPAGEGHFLACAWVLNTDLWGLEMVSVIWLTVDKAISHWNNVSSACCQHRFHGNGQFLSRQESVSVCVSVQGAGAWGVQPAQPFPSHPKAQGFQPLWSFVPCWLLNGKMVAGGNIPPG